MTKELYTPDFYNTLNATATASAKEVLPWVLQFTNQPQSICDVGCGDGAWLKVARELGIKRLRGMDGDWAPRDAVTGIGADFIPVDLATAKRISTKEKFDLVLSLEVGEHLPAEQADFFVRTLCKLGENVLFSAAQPGQGGTVGHINEQPVSYWQERFAANGFYPYDIRFIFKGNKQVSEWYRNNMLLYRKYKGINEFFPDVYWLNLDKRTDRRERMEQRLRQYGIQAERVSAIDGDEVEKPEDFDGLPGSYAFSLSQLSILQKAQDRNLDKVLIFEDDATFPVEFVKWSGEFLGEVPADWDIIYFGCNTASAQLTPVSPRVARVTDAYTTHAYAINRKVIDFMLNHPLRHQKTYDWILHEEQKHLNAYCCTPSIAYQEEGYSDILKRVISYAEVIR